MNNKSIIALVKFWSETTALTSKLFSEGKKVLEEVKSNNTNPNHWLKAASDKKDQSDFEFLMNQESRVMSNMFKTLIYTKNVHVFARAIAHMCRERGITITCSDYKEIFTQLAVYLSVENREGVSKWKKWEKIGELRSMREFKSSRPYEGLPSLIEEIKEMFRGDYEHRATSEQVVIKVLNKAGKIARYEIDGEVVKASKLSKEQKATAKVA